MVRWAGAEMFENQLLTRESHVVLSAWGGSGVLGVGRREGREAIRLNEGGRGGVGTSLLLLAGELFEVLREVMR